MYIAFPVLLYFGERIFRAIRSGFYEVDILKVHGQNSLFSQLCMKTKFKFLFLLFLSMFISSSILIPKVKITQIS